VRPTNEETSIMKKLKIWLFLQAAIFGCLACRLSAQPMKKQLFILPMILGPYLAAFTPGGSGRFPQIQCPFCSRNGASLFGGR
jgi:hypothetical protein